MPAIFTYRYERTLFAVIGVIIVAAALALMQVTAQRTGAPSLPTAAGTTLALGFEEGGSALVTGVRTAGLRALAFPQLEGENARLRAQNQALAERNARLAEALAAYRQQVAIAPRLAEYAGAIEARVIGFPPENAIQSVTIDKGTRNGVRRDDGVLSGPGVVGRVVEADPYTSKVALLTDFTSIIPAIVRRGRYWGVARGNQDSVRLQYVSQDAALRIGDVVVTGEARSFHSGAVLGTILRIDRSDSSLYQTAVLKPAVDFSSLDRVVVVPK